MFNAEKMKRLATTAVAAAALLALPAGADAAVTELGQTTEGLPAASCPAECTAIGKVTGFQVSNGSAKSHPMRVNREGHIVAFTVKLGTPDAEQRKFFERLFGSPAKVRLTILRPAKPRGFKIKRVSEEFNVERFFGSSPTFALSKPLPIGVKYEVALTTTTWAPILSVKRTNKEGWRSSRKPDGCDDVQEPAAHEAIGSARNYSCLHTTARLLYTASFVPNPKPTAK